MAEAEGEEGTRMAEAEGTGWQRQKRLDGWRKGPDGRGGGREGGRDRGGGREGPRRREGGTEEGTTDVVADVRRKGIREGKKGREKLKGMQQK